MAGGVSTAADNDTPKTGLNKGTLPGATAAKHATAPAAAAKPAEAKPAAAPAKTETKAASAAPAAAPAKAEAKPVAGAKPTAAATKPGGKVDPKKAAEEAKAAAAAEEKLAAEKAEEEKKVAEAKEAEEKAALEKEKFVKVLEPGQKFLDKVAPRRSLASFPNAYEIRAYRFKRHTSKDFERLVLEFKQSKGAIPRLRIAAYDGEAVVTLEETALLGAIPEAAINDLFENKAKYLNSVAIDTESNKGFGVKIKLKDVASTVDAFWLEKPNRLVIDTFPVTSPRAITARLDAQSDEDEIPGEVALAKKAKSKADVLDSLWDVNCYHLGSAVAPAMSFATRGTDASDQGPIYPAIPTIEDPNSVVCFPRSAALTPLVIFRTQPEVASKKEKPEDGEHRTPASVNGPATGAPAPVAPGPQAFQPPQQQQFQQPQQGYYPQQQQQFAPQQGFAPQQQQMGQYPQQQYAPQQPHYGQPQQGYYPQPQQQQYAPQPQRPAQGYGPPSTFGPTSSAPTPPGPRVAASPTAPGQMATAKNEAAPQRQLSSFSGPYPEVQAATTRAQLQSSNALKSAGRALSPRLAMPSSFALKH